MKRLLTMMISTFTLLALIGCGQNSDEVGTGQQHAVTNQPAPQAVAQPAPQAVAHRISSSLQFGTVKEFLYAHRAVMEGRATRDLAELATAVDFISLNELHVLTNLPETYRLHGIYVSEDSIGMWFFPEEAFVSMDAMHNARNSGHSFQLFLSRWVDMECPMTPIMSQLGLSERDLINGRYLFRESGTSDSFIWAHGRERFTMTLPRTLHGNHGISAFGDGTIELTRDNAHTMLPFTQTTTINLLDEALVTTLIGELYELTFNLGSALGEFAAFDTMDSINIPAGTNINSFISVNHDGLPMPGTSRNNGQFLGWYLDANFTMPLIKFLTTMPYQDTTLYARWEQDEN